jgi:rhamnose utilization protein RhaD (predicted bifunctional aldolase and dehydrogenase)
MNPQTSERVEGVILLSRELGREDRQLAILGEGNVSAVAGGGGGFVIMASGRSLATLTREGVVECRGAGLMGLLDGEDLADERVEEELLASRVDAGAAKPSVEAVFHAYLLGLPGVEWVGHTHPVAVNRVLCSPRAEEFAKGRMCPDEVVCCGEESVYVPYVDPGLKLARAIRERVEEFVARRGGVPRLILLANHGAITLGASANAVLGAMLMLRKMAEIWLGAAVLGGPVYLSEADVSRIAGRADEHYRQRALNL